MKDPNTIHSTTQQFLDIYDITNDILILKDGSASLVLQVNAVNFGLLAEAEQDAIIYAYAGLLNSLNFPVQIVIHSETKDVSHYLQSLLDQEEATTSDNRKNQIRKYRTFVSDLIRERNVLDKKFYFVIPSSALELGLVSPQSVIPGVKTNQAIQLDRNLILDRALTNLYPKRDHLIAQFARIGLYARQLATQEIIHLFYNLYNPESAEGQTISNTQNYTTTVVEAMQGDTMLDTSQNQTPPTSIPAAQATMPVAPTVPTAGMPAAPAPATSSPASPGSTAPTYMPSTINPLGETSPTTTPATTPTMPATPPVVSTTNALPPLPNLPTPPNPVAPTVPTITPAQPPMAMPAVEPLPTPPSMPAAATPATTAPAAAASAGTPAATNPAQVNTATTQVAVDSEQDAQSLINNTLQQIDPTALTTATPAAGSAEPKAAE